MNEYGPGESRKAMAYALRLLQMSDKTSSELVAKMRSKRFSEAVTAEVLEEMKLAGYVDDARYARDFAETRATCRGFGPIRIRIELERRGIPRRLAEEAVSRAFGEVEESESALCLAREWVDRRRPPNEARPRSRRRLYAFLSRRGFSPEVVGNAVRRVLGEEEG